LNKNKLYKYSTKSHLTFTEKHQFDEKKIQNNNINKKYKNQ
jgi:hypothetical protein